MPTKTRLFAALSALCTLNGAAAGAADGLCSRWSEPAKTGELDVKTVMEASGIAISRSAPRLYHINDGTEPNLFITDLKGGALQTVRLTGFVPQDIEDIALGRCGDSTCLYIADIGDNGVRRQSVQIAIVAETPAFGTEVAPRKVIVARYPDGPHDAEALAIHPSGDLYLVTKSRINQQQNPAQLFRLSATQQAASGEQTFEAVGTIPVNTLSASLGDSPRRIVTAMDITPDGRRFVLLTYDAAIEFAVDLQKGLPEKWVDGSTHRAFPIATLIQAEAIAYERDGRSLTYSTESVRGSAAPLTHQSCLD